MVLVALKILEIFIKFNYTKAITTPSKYPVCQSLLQITNIIILTAWKKMSADTTYVVCELCATENT